MQSNSEKQNFNLWRKKNSRSNYQSVPAEMTDSQY